MDQTSGQTVKFRPPSWVFSVIWPILYLMLGYSWLLSSQIDHVLSLILYSLLTLSLTSWIVVYSCMQDKKNSAYIILISIILTIMCMQLGDKQSKILLAPLFGWLIFALLMNTNEVDNTNR